MLIENFYEPAFLLESSLKIVFITSKIASYGYANEIRLLLISIVCLKWFGK